GERYDDIEELESPDEPEAKEAPAETGEYYDDIEELESPDEPAAKEAPAETGEYYDGIEELESPDEPEAKEAPAEAGEYYDDIEELESPDESEDHPESSEIASLDRHDSGTIKQNPGPVFLENGTLSENISGIGDEDASPNEATAPAYEDEAWLNLAGEIAAMEPSEIWAELTDADEADEAEETAVDKKTSETTEEEPPLFNSHILEWDPFGEETSGGVTESDFGTPGGLAERYITDYGEFIPAAADLEAANLAIEPLNNVEDFADAGIEDEHLYQDTSKKDETDHAFTPTRHQPNINEITRQIEFAAVDQRIAPPANDLNLDVSSPLDEIFSAKTINTDSGDAPVTAKQAQPAAGKTTKNVREVKAHKPLGTTDQGPLPQSHYRFFSQKSGDLEYFEAVEDENASSPIKKRDGVDYIDSALLKKDNAGEEKIDPKMKRLVDSVLQNR
ncbi:MAG: hypothetical protein LBD44_05900, partial [Spirochaetaceae bacterium]|nr:hypothetical protein [Spirochaetaceae bacterium]